MKDASNTQLDVRFVRRLQDGLLGLKSPTANELQAAVAYVTSDGLDALNSLGVRIGRATVGVAHQITEPDALKQLQSGGAQIRIADVEGEFHPKLYLIRYDDSIGAVVGSSNLTRGGILSNEEANVLLQGPKHQPPLNEILGYEEDLWLTKSVPLTQEFLESYKRRWESSPVKDRAREGVGAEIARSITSELLSKSLASAPRFWICVTSPQNFKICIAHGKWGVDRQVNTIRDVRTGDLLAFYVKGEYRFSGLYRMTSSVYHDSKPLWPNKLYPWRVNIEPMTAVRTAEAALLLPRLSFVRSMDKWGTYFEREMIRVDQSDFKSIAGTIKPGTTSSRTGLNPRSHF